MKRITLLAGAAVLASLVTTVPAQAEEGGMLEISGNIVTVTGYQRATAGKFGDATAGVLADGLAYPGSGTDQFGFFIDQVEIDLAKSFGENIRFRSDLDFFPFSGAATPGRVAGGGTADFLMEQAYVTTNIPAGNGWELLVGRFNSGIGLDPVDRNELATVSFSSVHRLLLPHNMTGTRLGYDWSDNFRGELFVVNSLGDMDDAATSDIPSFGFNTVYRYGDEGNPSWFKFTGAGGPEQATKKNWSFLGDMALSHATSDAFRVGLEGIYRQDNAVAAGGNDQYFAGTLQGTYAFSDVWDGTLRYGYTWDLDGATGGAAVAAANDIMAPGLPFAGNGGVRHDLAIATGYAITDGARFGLEGRFDLTNPSTAAEALPATGQVIGLAGTFAYNF